MPETPELPPPDPEFIAALEADAAREATDPRTENQKWADLILDGIRTALVRHLEDALRSELARIRPAVVAGLEAGANPRVISPLLVARVFPKDGASQ